MADARQGVRADAHPAGPTTTRRDIRSFERGATRPARRYRRGRQRPAPRSSARGLGRQLGSVAVLLLCGGLLVGLSVPASALHSVGGSASAPEGLVAQPVQTLVVGGRVVDAATAADGYDATSWADVLLQKYGEQTYDYTVGTGPIQWPFPFPVPISDGYGDRVSPCRGCSTYHQGIDFVPGAGQPVYVIAAGVVTFHEEDEWSYGNTVEIEHEIDGTVVTSKYAHLETGSSPLKLGDIVKVGDFLGLVGDTGATTGPHLHFEIWIDGEKVNPYTWLKHYAAD